MTLEVYYQHNKSLYSPQFRGTIEELRRLLSVASDVINEEIQLWGFTVDTAPEKLKETLYKAVCAQVDSITALGGIEALDDDIAGSVSLGKFSYTSASSDGASSQSSPYTLCRRAKSILAAAGLCYRGVRAI